MDWNNFQEEMQMNQQLKRFFDQLSAELPELPLCTAEGCWAACLQCGSWRIERSPDGSQARLSNTQTHIALCLPEAELYQLLERFLQHRPLRENARRTGAALVLSGGGARGAYEIGVWQALRELGIDQMVDGIAGSSIGAVNALLFALGDLGNAVRLWLELSDPACRQQNRQELLTGRSADHRWEGLWAALRVLKEDLFLLSQPELRRELSLVLRGQTEQLLKQFTIFSAAVDVTEIAGLFSGTQPLPKNFADLVPKNATYFSWNSLCEDEITEAILASAAIPGWYDPVRLRDRLYCDGGILDNTPVKPLYDCGYRKFIIVYLKREGSKDYQKVQEFLAARGDCRTIQIVPDLRDDFASSMNLNPALTQERMEAGHRDAFDQARRQIVDFIEGESPYGTK